MAKKRKTQDTSPLALGRQQEGSAANKRAKKTESKPASQSSSSSKSNKQAASSAVERTKGGTFTGGTGSYSSSRSSGSSSGSRSVTQKDRQNQKSYGTTTPETTTARNATKRRTTTGSTTPKTAQELQTQRSRTINESDRERIYQKNNATPTARTAKEMMEQREQRRNRSDSFLNSKQEQGKVSRGINRNIANTAKTDLHNAVTDNGAKISKADDLKARQTQKSGIQSRNKVLGIRESSTSNEIEGTLKQVIGGHLKALGDDSNEYSEYKDLLDHNLANGKITRAEYDTALRRWKRSSTKYDRYKDWETSDQHKAFQTLYKKGEKLYDEGTQRVNEAQEGASYLKKAYLNALGSGVGMATDAAAGPAWFASMLSRTYGGELGQAEKEGATRLEDRRYAGLQALKEVGTEGMFSAIGLPAKVVRGKGFFDAVAKRLTGGLTESGIKSALKRYGMGVAEENLEEVAGWALDPAIKNYAYGNDLWARQSRQSTRDEGDELRRSIASLSEGEVKAMAAHLNSEDYVNQVADEMIANGAPKEEADKIARAMQAYMNAILTGDKESEVRYEDEIVEYLKGENPYKDKLSWSELGETLASTTLLTGVTGIGGTISSAAYGNAIKETKGLDYVKGMAEKVKLYDTDNSAQGEAVSDFIDKGNDLSGTQIYDLSAKAETIREEAVERRMAKDNTAELRMRSEDLLVQPKQINPDGSYTLGEVTDSAYDGYTAEALDYLERSGAPISATDAGAIADAYGAYMTGVINEEQMSVINTDNPAAITLFSDLGDVDISKAVVRDSRGNIDVPKTNISIENALYAKAADHYVGYARLEQANWNDETRGRVAEAISPKVGGMGDEAIQVALDNVDPRDRGKFVLTAQAADRVYDYARKTDDDWGEVKSHFKEMFKGVDEASMQAVFGAAKMDKAIAEEKYYGKQVKMGEKNQLKGADTVVVPGKFTNESQRLLRNSEITPLSSAANALGINVIMTDDLDAGENGRYIPKERTIMLNSANTMGENLGAIFSHEVTHHLAAYAPEEYLKLSRFVMDRWYKGDPDAFNAQIEKIQKLYKDKKNQDLSPEEALEELIADGAGAFWTDEGFISSVAAEEPSLAKSIINAIKNILDKLRSILSAGNITDEDTREGLFAEIGVYDTAYKMWLDAYNTAAKLRADQAINDWQDAVNEESAEEARHSLGDDMVIQNGKARWTDDRIDSLIKDYGASNPDYSQAYAVLMNPRDYLKLTLSDEMLDRWNKGSNDPAHPETRSLNEEELRSNTQTPFLTIFSDDGMEVQGHEGRHRMRALLEAGVQSVPIVIKDTDTKYSKVPTESMTLTSQDFGYDPINDNAHVTVTDLVPIKEANRDELIQKFGGEADVKFSISDTDSHITSYSTGAYSGQVNMRTEYKEGDNVLGYVDWNDYEGTPSISYIEVDEDHRRKGIGKKLLQDIQRQYPGTEISFGMTTEDGTAFVDAVTYEVVDKTVKAKQEDLQSKRQELEKIGDRLNELYDKDDLTEAENAEMGKLGPEWDTLNSDIHDLENELKGQSASQRFVRFSISAEDREALNADGIDITESGTAVKYSLTSWNETDKEELLNRLVAAGYDRDAADKWIDQVDSIASIIYGDMARLNYDADRFQDALKPNSEYYYTLDLSTLCQKRRLYQGTYNAIMHRLIDKALHPNDTVRLRQMMEEMGLETPCGICYEESRKKNEGKFAETWLNGETESAFKTRMKNYSKSLEKYQQKLAEYNALEDKGKKKPPKEPKKPERWMGYANMEHDDPYIPTLADVTTTDGRARLRKKHPAVLEAYLEYQKGRGSANPKVSFTHTDYRGDILRMTKTDVENVKHIGGLRIQSFSDFETIHVIDMMQAIMDMATMKLTSQAYTKVPAFADIFGGAGIKINLSLIQKMDENGNPVYGEDGRLVFDSKEGIDPDEAFRIRGKYSKNVGTILVGVSRQQILDAWADDRVDMVIPFHRSGWSLEEFEKLGLKGYEDFQEFQSERYFDPKEKKWISLKDAKMEGIYSADYWDKNLSGKENAERYLELCAKKHYRPVFYNFLHDNGDGTWSLPTEEADGYTADGYWKSLIDYKMYDNEGEFAPQEEVQPIFDMEVAQNVMGEYEGNADTLPVAEDVVEAYLKDYKKRHPKAKLNLDGDVRLSLAVDLDDQYMQAVNSGNMEEAQRLVDEAAKMAGFKPVHRYHGTMNAGFTVFDKAYAKVGGNSGAGFYFSTEEDDSVNHYADVEGADNYFKWSELAEQINQQIADGTWEGPELETYEEIEEYAKEQLNKEPGTFDVYLNYKNPYIRDYGKSTDLFEYIMDGFDESIIDRNDYDSEDDYEDDLLQYKDEYFFDTITKAVYEAYDQIEGFYDYVDLPNAYDLASAIAGNYDYNLNWETIENEIYNMSEATLARDEWDGSGDGTRELTRAIIEALGFDAVEDKEVSSKFGQLSREMMTDTEHVIVFKPEQIKLSDPVTYAEDGSVIPLSERFDPNNNDIRYSLPTQDADDNILSDDQMEYFKNSQARDEQGRLVPVYHTTNKGGFTIFDPMRSDDHRCLFFASNWDVSQTYGNYANSRFYYFDIDNVDDVRKYLDTYGPDLYVLTKDEFEQAGGYEGDFLDFENVGPSYRFEAVQKKWDKSRSSKDTRSFLFDSYVEDVENGSINPDDYVIIAGVPDYSPDHNSYADTWVLANSPDELVKELHNHFGWQRDNYRMGTQHGYYSCYLNLEDPMLVDARGAYWDSIPFGDEDSTTISEDAELIVHQIKITHNNEESGLDLLFVVDEKYEDEWERRRISEWFEKSDDIYAFLVNQWGLDPGYIDDVMESVDRDGNINYWAEDYIGPNGDYLDPEDYSEDTYTTRQLASIAEERGHDGVVIRNCLDHGGKSAFDGLDELSDIYIAFSSNQVKDVDNKKPTENPDIRYSVTSEDEALDWLASQYDVDDVPLEDNQAEEGRVRIAKSKKDFIASKDKLWNERWLTEGKVLDLNANHAKKNIRNLVMGVMANSSGDKAYKTELVDQTLIAAKSAFWLMKDDKYADAGKVIYDAAVKVMEDADYLEDTMYKDYKELRDYLRTTRIQLGEEYWADVDYADFRRRNLGRMKIVKGDTNVDKILDELYYEKANGDIEGIAPEWFSPEAFEKNGYKIESVPDILLQIETVLDKIQPYRVAYTSEEAQDLIDQIANDLWDIVYEGTAYKSIADTYKERYDAKTKALKERHEEALRKVKEDFSKKVDKEKKKLKDYKEKEKRTKEKAKHFGNIQDNIDWLTTRLLNETKDKNIPEGFRKSLAHLLMQFDMQTSRSKKLEEKYGPAKKTLKIRELKSRLEQIAKEDDSGEFRYDGYLFYLMDALAEKVDGKEIDSLDMEDLIVVDTMLKSICHNFRNYSKVRLQEKQVEISSLGDKTIDVMERRIQKYGKRKKRGALDTLLNEGEETPVYFFGRLDPNNEGIGAMWQELERGEDKHIRNMAFLRERFTAICGDYFNKKKPGSVLESWRDSSQAQPFNLTNGTITLTPAQIMSLYCLSKRQQALGHILGAGIVSAPVTASQKLSESIKEKIKGKEEQVNSVIITYPELQTIIQTLSPEQMHIADELQALMNNEMSAWGNETSLEMHGIKLFREKDYFPIKSSNEVLSKTADSFDVQEKIKNFGFTKPLVKNADNAIMIDDIFSVVADHCNKMSLYNAFSIPISDFMRVYNYKQKNEDGSVKTVQSMIGEAFTRKANSYIMKFIGDINGNTQTRSDAVNDLMNKALANYKKASVGLNVRVALQQITSIFRSWMVINPKYFNALPSVSPKDMREMFEHCPKALWKSWGHYDVDMGRDIEDIMMNNDWSRFDMISMGGYGWLDNVAWTTIWQAVKAEMKDKHPELKPGTDEYWEACNVRAKEIFDKTQVVDSIFNRSDIMRSKNTLTKMTTSFMAEPTLTYNVMRNSIVEAVEAFKDGDGTKAMKLLTWTAFTLAVNFAATSAAAAIWDAVRGKGADDDDDRKWGDLWWTNFLENLKDNANPISNIYFIKDIWSLKDGWGTSNMALEGWETMITGLTQMKKKITEGSDKSWYDIMMNFLGGIGYVTGYPVKTFMRDAKAILEKLDLDVFADDGTVDESIDGVVEKLKLFDFGKEDNGSDKRDSETSEMDLPDSLTDEQKAEIKKAEERRNKKKSKNADEQTGQLDHDTMLYNALKAGAGLEGEEYNKKVYSSVSNGLKGYVADGDYASIAKMRDVIEEAGGDVEYFDKRVLEETKRAYKKTFGYDQTIEEYNNMKSQWRYMVAHGMTAEEISSEIIYKSDMAKDMKVAYRVGDESMIVESMQPLLDAGITKTDLEKLYTNRNRVQIKNYDGRWKDKLKSTGTFIWPTQGTITSQFGYRNAPTAGASSNHPAIDIGAPSGSEVVAADGGTVIYVGWNGGYGNSVGIKHDNGMVTYYNHLSGYNVKEGDTVAQGQPIAQVGSTGISTGPHLDFKVLDTDGNPVDPEKYLS